MKKSVRILAVTVCLLLANLNGWGQVSYLGLDGGLEGSATIDNAGLTGPASGKWTKNNATQTIANETGTVRSGSNALRVNNGTTGRRVWSPNFTVSSTTSNVTIQYYKRVANITNAQEDQPGIINNTEGISGAYNAFPSVAGNWVKVTYTKASSTFTTISGLLLTRQIGTGGDIFIDDMAVYTGAVDNTPPNSPTATVSVVQNGVTPTTKLDVSWGAASGGIDGGGYLVVRYAASAPVAADDPNQNGIYAVGNSIAVTNTGTVAYVGTATSFTDAGLSSGTTYYYKIYTFDKAYNYSAEFSNTGTGGTTATSGFAITVTQSSNGTISPGTTNVASGANQTFTITPAACYSIASLTVDGSSVTVANSYTFTNVTATHTITATYSLNGPYNITATAGANGTITPTASVSCGGNKTFTITPDPCYAVADVLVDGVSVGAVTSYTFSNVTASHTISASFVSSASYAITASAGPNGSISPSGITSVACGNNQTYTITPNSCYNVADVLVDGVSVGAVTSYTFNNVTTVHTISVSFVVKSFGVNASAGANGTVTPAGTTSVNCGNNQTYTIAPASCYHVLDVLVDGVSVGAVTSYTFTNVQAAHTISATFALNSSSNIVASAGANGGISPSGTTAVTCGANQTYTITPNAGYVVASVVVDGSSVGAVTTYTFTSVTASHTISATFAAVSITTSVLIPNFICPGGTVSVPYTISATIPSTTFSAQLSDASGGFANTTSNIVGTLTSTTSGTISATIPTSTPNGSGYRIRVLTSSIIGTDNTQNITIRYSTVTALPGFTQENMGSVAVGGTTTIATQETNNAFANVSLTMSGTADIRNTTNSTGYSGASGGNNVFITTTAGLYFQINGINTLGYSSVLMTLGVYKSAAGDNGAGLGIAVSSDGTTFSTPVALSTISPLPTVSAGWSLVKLGGIIPSSATAAIKFVQLSTSSQYRLDDINLYYGTAVVPSITPSAPAAQCGGTITLTASPNLSDAASVTWSNAATTSSINAASTGNYSATITDGFGCVSNQGPVAVNITVPLVPSVTISNAATAVCAGVSNTFTATPVNAGSPSYQWNKNGLPLSGATNSTYTAAANSLNNGDAITVSVTATGCVSAANITSNTLNAQKLAYSPAQVYQETYGTTTTTDISTYVSPLGWTYTPSNSSVVDLRTSLPSPNGGCNIFFVGIGSPPAGTRTLVISGINTNTAFPNALSMEVYKAGSVTTMDNSNFNIEVSADGVSYKQLNYTALTGTAAWYTLTFSNVLPKGNNIRIRFTSDVAGSSTPRVDNIIVTGYTTGDASISPNGTVSLCSPATQTLSALPNPGSGLTYAWSNSTNGTSINVSSTSTSSVTITDVFGCQSSASQLVTVNTPSIAPASISGTTTLCSGTGTVLTAVGGTLGSGANYQWGTGSTVGSNIISGATNIDLSVTPSGTTTYWVRIVNTASPCTPATGGVTQEVTVNPNVIYYRDFDGDTYGDASNTSVSCTGAPTGYVANNTDCNDNNGNIHPGAIEVCGDGLDNDCSGGDLACSSVNTWIGNTTQWSSPSNWNNGVVPNACGDHVLIPSSPAGGNYPALGATSYTVGNLTIQDNATITIGLLAGNTRTLSVCGNIVAGSSTNAVITGTSSNGLVLIGSGAQQISGKLRANIVNVNNSSTGVTVTGNLEIVTALLLTAGNVTNSGTVTLKSDATSTAYLDNFTSGTAGNYTGNLTVERYVSNAADGYRDISSPVNTKVSDLNDDFPVFGQNAVHCWYAYNPYPNVQYYNESNNAVTNNYYGGFWSYTGLNNTLTAIKGIAIRTYQGAPFTLDFTGAPYNGAQSAPVTFTNTGNVAADGWNLVGNCYPSPILWNKVKLANPGELGATYYVFQTMGEYAGNWGSSNGTTTVNGATNEIASSQGFWVLASGNSNLDMNNGVRTASATTQFFKTNEVQPDEIRLSLSNGNHRDEIVTYSDPNATSGYDFDYDGLKMTGGTSAYMSFAQGDKEYAINVINAVTENTELPLTLWAQESGLYTISATELNLNGLTAYLKDSEARTETELTHNITVPLTAGQLCANRYSVVFKQAASTGIHAVVENNIRIYSYNNRVVIEKPGTGTANIQISNVLGQQITMVNTNSERTELPLAAGEPWYAFVKVTEGNHQSIAKVIIQTK